MQSGTTVFANRNADWINHNRNAACDADGNFVFENVPAKSWYVIADLTWIIPTQPGAQQQGSPLYTT